MSDSRLVRFAPDAYWRGETHRLGDRPGSIGRLIEEAAAAGAEQVMIVAAIAGAARARTNCDRRGSTAWAASANRSRRRRPRHLSDAVRHLHHRFQGLYLIRPSHNPIRPLDLAGAYDERSDRVQTLEELMERGYEDAYRQFIEPFLGASGERVPQLGRRSTDQDDERVNHGF